MLQDRKFREVTMKNKLVQERTIARRDILSPLCQLEYILKKCRPFIARHGQERNKLKKKQLEAWKEELEELLNREDLDDVHRSRIKQKKTIREKRKNQK